MSAVRNSLAALLVLAGCGGSPFPADSGGGGGSGGGTGSSALDLPGKLASDGTVSRREDRNKGPNGAVTGNGFAFTDGKINYDSTADTFTISNLAFDGTNVYHRLTPAAGSDLASDARQAQIYAGDGVVADNQTGALIDQFSYRALYGESKSQNTHFAIVRTGAYAGYGFGGFIYNRKGGVTLPTSGFAEYSGSYAGLRDSDQGGLQYTTGDMNMKIDFVDSLPAESTTGNDASVRGYVNNRHIFDLAGNDITGTVLAAMNDAKNSDEPVLPTLAFAIGPGVLDNSGEMEGDVGSLISVDGSLTQFEAGKYYAVISGAAADEVAGIIVVTSKIKDVEYRETGGFILYRP